jgi:hypothetical protein
MALACASRRQAHQRAIGIIARTHLCAPQRGEKSSQAYRKITTAAATTSGKGNM